LQTLFRDLKARGRGEDQRGINMVDLMMWLVIAALLLAAAIQGIGFYQRAAYLYHVENDVMGGATKVLSVSGIDHNGNIDQPIVDDGLAITQKTAQVVLASDVDPNGRPMIRGTHPGLPGKEVDYFFYPYAGYAASTVYVVDVGTVPSGSTTISGGGVLPAGFLPRGDWNHNGTPNSMDLPPAGTPIEDLSSPGMGDGTSAATVGTITGDGSGSFNPSGPLYDYGIPMSNTLPSGKLDMTGWTYDPATNAVKVTMRTDGTYSGIGGSWIVMGHFDISCFNTQTKVSTDYHPYDAAMLQGPYGSNQPGPNITTLRAQCPNQYEVMSQALFRTASDAEWADYSLGRIGYAYTMPSTLEGWVNPNKPS